MSASSKKKLRKQQESQQMTERQQHAQKEAKKLKIYTAIFVVVLVALVVTALWVGISRGITKSGVLERNTTALTVGEHEISNAELNYFFVEEVNNFYRQYGGYAAFFGLDVTKPLDEQVTNEETGATWADDFLTSAKSACQSAYALADAANAAGYTLSEDELASVDATISNMELYGMLYGYPDLDSYLKGMYGYGASEESYRAYIELTMLASSYYNHYSTTLSYDDAALREAEADKVNTYSSFTYDYYYLNASTFLTGGTTDENGKITYTEEEKAAAVAAAEEAAKSLAVEENNTTENLTLAINRLEVFGNDDNSIKVNSNVDTRYTNITSAIAEWLTAEGRKAGDIGYIANSTTTTAEDGTENTVINGYYVVLFHGVNDNTFALANVRHILVMFQGGTTDGTTGTKVYSDEEKAAAKDTIEKIYDEWKSGDANEDSFAKLAGEKSEDGGSKNNGGLYEDIYPGQMVTNFNNWCFDEARQAGDTGIVETEYGYHLMFYSGDSDTNYRDFLISGELRAADTEAWYVALIEAAVMTDGNTKYINTSLVLSAS